MIRSIAVIEGDVVIGSGSVIHHHAFVGNGARIGKNCQVHHGAVVSNVPQDLKFKGTEKTYVELGDRSVVREFATLHRGTIHTADTNAGTKDGVTRIGQGCLIMAYAHVAHDCTVGDEVILANAVQLAGHVTIERWANIGGACLVHQFSLIGTMSMIGGGAQIRKDIPPFAFVGGDPTAISGINRVGMQRRGCTPEVVEAIKSCYSTLYFSGLNISAGLEQISTSDLIQNPEAKHVVAFIRSSKRGVLGRQ